MPDQKTTVYLEPAEYRKLQALARLDGRSAADLFREAVAEYNARRTEARLPRSLGAGRSGREDFSERSEEMLAGMGEEE